MLTNTAVFILSWVQGTGNKPEHQILEKIVGVDFIRSEFNSRYTHPSVFYER